MKRLNIGQDFTPYLTNRNKEQRDGKHTAIEFREKFLSDLEQNAIWESDEAYIILDFDKVERLGPSWANEVFAYFTRNHSPEEILKKIRLENISRVKRQIIEGELRTGYCGVFE